MTTGFALFNQDQWMMAEDQTPETFRAADVANIIGFLVIREADNYRMVFSVDGDDTNYFATIPEGDWFFDTPMSTWNTNNTVYDTRTGIVYIVFLTDDVSVKGLEKK